MDYTPRHSQPFTLEEAIGFDASEIIEEISRLENSLVKLRETQDFLQSYLEATPDAEIAQVLEENKAVIESQKERISILKMALIEKGILSSSHYETTTPLQSPAIINHNSDSASNNIQTATSSESLRQIETEEGDPGVYL